jgi:hypothetical protein
VSSCISKWKDLIKLFLKIKKIRDILSFFAFYLLIFFAPEASRRDEIKILNTLPPVICIVALCCINVAGGV